MNTEKLLRLADLVETIAPEKFDLRQFWDGHGCGCALGHAASSGEFPGLILFEDECGWDVSFNGRTGARGSAECFDTNFYQMCFLTHDNQYVTGLNGTPSPKEVAIRIRLFVENEKVVRELELA